MQPLRRRVPPHLANCDDDDPRSPPPDDDDDDDGGGEWDSPPPSLRGRVVKKLNTDYLFRGMPSIEHMLGGGGSGGGDSSGGEGGGGGKRMTRMSSTTATTTTTAAEGELLTFEEARAIDIRYERQKRDATRPDALLVGSGGGAVAAGSGGPARARGRPAADARRGG